MRISLASFGLGTVYSAGDCAGALAAGYPSASGYASAPGTPLTPAQSAQYNADRAVYNNCLQVSQGAPSCPPGQSYVGENAGGVWQGGCVDTTTGVQAPITSTPGTFTPTPQVVPAYVAPTATAAVAAAPAPVQAAAATTPVAVTTPASGTTIVAATPAAAAVACAAGYTVDANGVCTLYTDAELINGMNSIQWTGSGDIPTEQVTRVMPQVTALWGPASGWNGIAPGSVFAYVLGLGAQAAEGTQAIGANNVTYQMNGGYWQIASTVSTLSTAGAGNAVAAAPGTAVVASPTATYPAGSFSTTYAGALLTDATSGAYDLVQINSDGSGTVLGSLTTTQLSGVTLTAPVSVSGGLMLDAADFSTLSALTGSGSLTSLISNPLVLGALAIGAYFLATKK